MFVNINQNKNILQIKIKYLNFAYKVKDIMNKN